MSGTGQILLKEGEAIGEAIGEAKGESRKEAEMNQLLIRAGQLRDEGITDIEEYRKEGISDIIYNVVLGIKPNN